ncbi:hypothetical protein BOTBODRAFT_145526 [Botryobasidium botryosum FD-172 SS1]|uniref:Uncharacterized protein n=1 Tax=Botryobasidium botryosum (strain FD-172 SS1) TaxID=930990 RepID=A0A067MIZ1_BOTB1|nr:hypothetical protein BOTBODRAFT_145526 [Botryobasidium botryosum FD-172 SS1]
MSSSDLSIPADAQYQLVELVSSLGQLNEAKEFIDSAKADAFSQRPYPIKHIEDSEKEEFEATLSSVANLTDEITKVIPWMVSFSSPQEHQGIRQLIYKASIVSNPKLHRRGLYLSSQVCVLQEQRHYYQSGREPMLYLFSLPELREMRLSIEHYLRNINQFLVSNAGRDGAT